MIHNLKTWPEYFQPLAEGKKTFEIRLDDRPYSVGDVLVLKEWSEATGYTGNEVRAQVSYLLRDDVTVGVPHGFVIMSISAISVKNGPIHIVFSFDTSTPAPEKETTP